MPRFCFLLFALICCGTFAQGGNPDFPQTGQTSGGQPSGGQSSWGQSDWSQSGGGQAGMGPGADAPNPGAPNPGPSNAAVRHGPDGNRRADKRADRRDREDENSGGNSGNDSGDDGSDSAQYGGDEAPSMDLAGARANFAAVVSGYVATKSPKGYWPYVEKKGGKKVRSWRLLAPAVSERSVRKERDQRFSALATLRDARSRRKLALEFVVDFGGTDWKVVSVKPASSRR